LVIVHAVYRPFFFITGVCSVTNSDRKIRVYRVERVEIMRLKRAKMLHTQVGRGCC
jgi:hypothetical protein